MTPTPPPTPDDKLLPCPFCGSPPVRFTIEDDMEVANVGGDVIACTKCQCSTRVFFGEKVGIEEAWNTRAVLARMSKPEVGADDEAFVSDAPDRRAELSGNSGTEPKRTIINDPSALPLHLQKTGTAEEDSRAVEAFEHAVVQRIVGGGPPENRVGLYNINRRRLDAHTARLRAEISTVREMSASWMERHGKELARAEAAESALAACRDKVIEECADLIVSVTGLQNHSLAVRIRALADKEQSNG